MYVSKGKAKISLPHRVRTSQPIDTEIGRHPHISHTTHPVKCSYDRMIEVVRAERAKTLIFHFLPFFFLFPSIPITTSE
jgi:hypothetical protein